MTHTWRAMRSYIKLLGPPILEGIKALEKIAVDMPEVCMMHQTFIKGMSPRIARDVGLEPRRESPVDVSRYGSSTMLVDYFRSSGVMVSEERCESIISDSGKALGEHDFFFEWFEKPSLEKLSDLTSNIDEALDKVGCLYTITSKK